MLFKKQLKELICWQLFLLIILPFSLVSQNLIFLLKVKFNNSSNTNKDYIEKMKQHIALALEICNKENVSDAPVK